MKNDEIMKILVRQYTDMVVATAKGLLEYHARVQRDWSEKDYNELMNVIRTMNAHEDQILKRAEYLKTIDDLW